MPGIHRDNVIKIAVVCLVLFVVLFLRAGRHRTTSALEIEQTEPEVLMVLSLVHDLLDVYASQGLSKRPNETLVEFIERIEPNAPDIELARRITACHELIRFAEKDVHIDELQRLNCELDETKKKARQAS